MSINSVLNIATSGLFASQSGIKTVSQNIANVNTKGYVRVEQEQQAVSLANKNAGVEVSSLRRAANRFLQAASINATGDEGNQAAKSQYISDLQSFFGDPTSESSLFSKVNQSLAVFETAVSNPGSVSVRRDIIANMQSLLAQLSQTSVQIQNLRTQADSEVGSTINQINKLLSDVAAINGDITRGVIQGDATGAQERQSQIIDELSQLIDIRVDFSDDGVAKIYTSDGMFLAGFEASQLNYTPSGSGQTFYDTIGITYGNDPLQRTMETAIQSGKLRGLLDVRNRDLPDMAEYVGEFAAKFADAVNAVHNVSATLPAISNAQGIDTGLLAADAMGFTGQTAIGIVATDGSLQRKINIDFNAGTISVNSGAPVTIGATVGSFVTALNTALGGVGSASFANGALRLSSSAIGSGFVFDEPPTNQSLRGDKAFAHFFGLNNLVSSSQQTSYATGLSALDAHGFTVGDTFEMRLVTPNGAAMTNQTITIPAGNIGNIITSLNNGATGFGLYGAFALDSKGALKWTPNSGNESLKLEMTKDTSPRTGSALSFGQLFGLSQGARMNRGSALSVNSQIVSDPRKLGLAMPDLSTVALGAVALGLGDAKGAEAIFDVTRTRINFNSGLGVQGSSMTLGEFISSIGGDLGTRASNAEANMTTAQNIKSEADIRRSNVEGVNLDEELVKLTAFQQAYSASARMIKAADEMYDALLAAIR